MATSCEDRGWALSAVQHEIWRAQQLHPGSTAYQVGGYLEFTGQARPGLVEAAARSAVAEADALHLRIEVVDGEPRLLPDLAPDWPLPRVDLTDPDAFPDRTAGSSARQAAEEWMLRDFVRLPDPGDPLFAISLLILAPDLVRLVVRADHLVIDGVGMAGFARRVLAVYGASLHGEPPPDSGWVGLDTFAEAEAAYRGSEAYAQDRTFWTDRMTGRSAVAGLAGRRGRTLVPPLHHEHPVPEDLAGRLRPVAEELGVAWPALVVAATAAYVHRATGRTDLVVGFPLTGRLDKASRSTPAMTANVVPLRLAVHRELSLGTLARQAFGEIAEVFVHQLYPHDELLHDLALDGGVFDVAVNVLPFKRRAVFGEQEAASLNVLTNGPTDDLYVGFHGDPGTGDLAIRLDAHPDVYLPSDLERHRDGVLRLLAAGLDDPDRLIGAMDVLDAGERRALLAGSAAAPAPGTESSSLLADFEAQAARTPSAVAVIDGDRRVTYAELDARAARLAHILAGCGVRAESPVVVTMDRSADMVAALLAVWRAGGCFVPVDPHAPAARWRTIARDCAAVLLLADRRPDEAGVPVVVPADADGPDGDGTDAHRPDGAQAAYAMFTSGSTGRPKAVSVSHAALANRVRWAVRAHGLGAADRVLQKTALTFDASLWEVFAPLAAGGTVVLAPSRAEHDPEAIVRSVIEHGVTVLQAVPSVLRLLVDVPRWPRCTSLRLLFSAGELLDAGLAQRAVGPLGVALWNTYGPTECAIDVSAQRFDPEQQSGPVPIGRPIDGARLLVLTEDGDLAPRGVAGELFVGGAGLARGYLGRPELTARSFVPDPFGPPGSRLYRTGDLVRRREDGVLEYLGRLDAQLKVNGVRVEPAEVEAALAEHPDVRGAVVLAEADGGGGQLLCAYLTVRRELVPGELRAFLADRLPAPLLPAVFRTVEAFPLTRGGKTDRAALRGGGAQQVSSQGSYVPPRTPAETMVAEAWGRLLTARPIGANDDFFQLGGTSLLVTRLAEELRAQTGRPVSFRRLFERTTVAEQAELIQAASDEDGTAVSDASGASPRAEEGAPAELSFGQYRLWALDQADPGSPEWAVPAILRLPPCADRGQEERRVGAALRALAERHEILRTRYADGPDGPVSLVDPAGPVRLTVYEGPEDGVPDACAELLRHGFDLAAGPVWRALLLRVPGAPSRLLLALHHIACDGWSVVLLERDFQRLYEQTPDTAQEQPRNGSGQPLPSLTVRYADHAARQRREQAGGAFDDQLAYWRTALDGLPVLELPTDYRRPAKRDPRGALASFTVPPDAAERLLRLGREHGATPFMTLLTGFCAVLSRYSGQTDLAVGTPVAGRAAPGLDDVVGFFLNTLVLRCDTGGDPTFRQLLERVRGVCRAAFARQDLPFERLVDELRVPRDPSSTPLYRVAFDLHEEGLTSTAMAADDLAALGAAWRVAKTDLTVLLRRRSDGSLLGALEYAAALFAPETAAQLAQHLAAVLERAGETPDMTLSELSGLVVEATTAAATTASPAHAPDGWEPVPDVVAAQACRVPEEAAVISADSTVSYSALDARAGHLGRVLREAGAVPGTVVGVLLGAEPDLIAGLLAVWRAGAAYLPLDPDTPAERIAQTLDDADAVAVLTSSSFAGRLAPGRPSVLVDGANGADRQPTGAGLEHRPADPDQLAYVIYTSGSTGRSKGVQVTHRALAAYMQWTVEAVAKRGAGGAPLLSSIAYDLVVTALYGPLMTGQPVHMLPERLPTAELGPVLAARGPFSFLKLTPGHLEILSHTLDAPTAAGLARTLVVAGEVLPAPLAERWLGLLGPGRLINEYRPTEAAVGTTVHPVDTVVPGVAVPIGEALPHATVHVLDEAMRPLPRGAVGELYVGGAGVARGYLGRPGLTARSFVPDPFGPPGSRLYRTGDRARIGVAGAVDFRGRFDDQVKVRGFRVEPAEVQAVLLEHAAVRDAFVTAGDGRLTAYLVPADGGELPDAAELAAHARRKLPEHMVPAWFVAVDEMPLTGNGKVDRAALPAPQAAAATAGIAPRTPEEARIVELWEEALGVPVGVHDDFFWLGGHSMLAIRMIARVREDFAVDLPATAFFDDPTPAGLARRVLAAIEAELDDLSDEQLAAALAAVDAGGMR
ncbi:amino acid adenylation domain-containing protein [Streptomyces sp. NPDC057582]|uniref:amino acid adenylation domain-containing protein n=1 Tax=Streptomyces sp. NPDC057582 TaxID=3346174 RepID=UPI0036846072